LCQLFVHFDEYPAPKNGHAFSRVVGSTHRAAPMESPYREMIAISRALRAEWVRYGKPGSAAREARRREDKRSFPQRVARGNAYRSTRGGPLIERRKTVRRQADKELLQRLREQQALIERLKTSDSSQVKRERRHLIRHNCRVVIKLVIGSSAGYSNDWAVDEFEVKGRLMDLSHGGAALATRQPLETSQHLRLEIALPNKAMVRANGAVRWVKAIPEKGAFACGVQFVDISKKEQSALNDFLNTLDFTSEK